MPSIPAHEGAPDRSRPHPFPSIVPKIDEMLADGVTPEEIEDLLNGA